MSRVSLAAAEGFAHCGFLALDLTVSWLSPAEAGSLPVFPVRPDGLLPASPLSLFSCNFRC
jgi:hypothetical protein